MMIEIHHIGIVVENIESSMELFSAIGFNFEGEKIIDTIQNNILQMLIDSKGNRIELIQPLNEMSTVNIKSQGLHHIAIKTDDEVMFRKVLRERKIGKVFTPNIKAPLFNYSEVFFSYMNNNVIIEVVQI